MGILLKRETVIDADASDDVRFVIGAAMGMIGGGDQK
jgi:hypothetical protein